MDYYRFFIDNNNPNDIVLDIGCGNGALALDLSKKAKEVFAIDINKKNISKAKEEYSVLSIRYIVGDAVVYNFNQKFDKSKESNCFI